MKRLYSSPADLLTKGPTEPRLKSVSFAFFDAGEASPGVLGQIESSSDPEPGGAEGDFGAGSSGGDSSLQRRPTSS